MRRCKLSSQDKEDIRELRKMGAKLGYLASRYNVTKAAIWKVLNPEKAMYTDGDLTHRR